MRGRLMRTVRNSAGDGPGVGRLGGRLGWPVRVASEASGGLVAGGAGRALPRTEAETRRLDLLLRVAGTLLFTLMVSSGAQVAIPLPPDGVPMTLQTLAVLMAALCLGPKLATASMVLYLAVGMVGAGVFAQGEKGLAVILGQTGGYLIGFILCQPVVGAIARRRDGTVRGWGGLLLAVLAGNAVIFAIGVPWLGVVNGFGVERALQGGFYPFIPGTIVETALAVWIGRRVAPWSARRGW